MTRQTVTLPRPVRYIAVHAELLAWYERAQRRRQYDSHEHEEHAEREFMYLALRAAAAAMEKAIPGCSISFYRDELEHDARTPLPRDWARRLERAAHRVNLRRVWRQVPH